jgi:hypothetical protein
MHEQKELFDLETVAKVDRKIAWAIILLSFSFLFALLGFMVYMFWDFGVAGRVVLFLLSVIALAHFAVLLARRAISLIRRR